jgi:Holliday junction resolvase
MNIFTKTKIKELLNKKMGAKEIIGYKLSDKDLFITIRTKRKKRSVNYKVDRCLMSDEELLKILYRKIPGNIDYHFKMEIRNVKIRRLIDKR